MSHTNNDKDKEKKEKLDSLHPSSEKGPQKDNHPNQFGEQEEKGNNGKREVKRSQN